MTMFKLQYLIILSVCLYSRFSYGFPYELLYNGAKIVTYGEPCYPTRYLSGKVEEPILPMATESTLSKVYQPLKLNYRVISTEPVSCPLQREYPISVEIPQIPQPLTIVTPDIFRGKSYEYNIQVPSFSPMPISRNYNFDVQVPLPPSTTIPKYTNYKFLTNLTSKVDKILIPACEVPSSNYKTCV
ncbi:hypothetical protein DMN91_004456 [Ooceraea biroi]|uniref:Uncharacterized protein n=1 Tax=Ooceraea biroi TaxID=2015173 RepID=A0A026VXK7_OOCBI|nr:uncharacterized protein LOC105286380 [Ooceraea biroi]EZA47589.1 hypothetical protein X777_15656 [Ooceraea biroi]RLU24245.1 hypothetical protein DMN91_004456 [Ooceraea biroi]